MVKNASPGDVIMIQAILLPKKKEGEMHKSDILFNSYLEATSILREKKKYVEMDIDE